MFKYCSKQVCKERKWNILQVKIYFLLHCPHMIIFSRPIQKLSKKLDQRLDIYTYLPCHYITMITETEFQNIVIICIAQQFVTNYGGT